MLDYDNSRTFFHNWGNPKHKLTYNEGLYESTLPADQMNKGLIKIKRPEDMHEPIARKGPPMKADGWSDLGQFSPWPENFAEPFFVQGVPQIQAAQGFLRGAFPKDDININKNLILAPREFIGEPVAIPRTLAGALEITGNTVKRDQKGKIIGEPIKLTEVKGEVFKPLTTLDYIELAKTLGQSSVTEPERNDWKKVESTLIQLEKLRSSNKLTKEDEKTLEAYKLNIDEAIRKSVNIPAPIPLGEMPIAEKEPKELIPEQIQKQIEKNIEPLPYEEKKELEPEPEREEFEEEEYLPPSMLKEMKTEMDTEKALRLAIEREENPETKEYNELTLNEYLNEIGPKRKERELIIKRGMEERIKERKTLKEEKSAIEKRNPLIKVLNEHFKDPKSKRIEDNKAIVDESILPLTFEDFLHDYNITLPEDVEKELNDPKRKIEFQNMKDEALNYFNSQIQRIENRYHKLFRFVNDIHLSDREIKQIIDANNNLEQIKQEMETLMRVKLEKAQNLTHKELKEPPNPLIEKRVKTVKVGSKEIPVKNAKGEIQYEIIEHPTQHKVKERAININKIPNAHDEISLLIDKNIIRDLKKFSDKNFPIMYQNASNELKKIENRGNIEIDKLTQINKDENEVYNKLNSQLDGKKEEKKI